MNGDPRGWRRARRGKPAHVTIRITLPVGMYPVEMIGPNRREALVLRVGEDGGDSLDLKNASDEKFFTLELGPRT